MLLGIIPLRREGSLAPYTPAPITIGRRLFPGSVNSLALVLPCFWQDLSLARVLGTERQTQAIGRLLEQLSSGVQGIRGDTDSIWYNGR